MKIKFACIKIIIAFIIINAFCSFYKSSTNIDNIVLKIKSISYAPVLNTMFYNGHPSDGYTFESIKLSLTNTGSTECYIDFRKSYLMDKDNNMYYYTYMDGQTYKTIKPGKTEKYKVYYEFPENETPTFLVLGSKVFEAKEEK